MTSTVIDHLQVEIAILQLRNRYYRNGNKFNEMQRKMFLYYLKKKLNLNEV